MRYLRIALIVLALFGAYDYFASRPIDWRPGVLVAAEPVQVELAEAPPIEHGSFRLLPRATFVAEARVLSRERYRTGALAEASPLDIAPTLAAATGIRMTDREGRSLLRR